MLANTTVEWIDYPRPAPVQQRILMIEPDARIHSKLQQLFESEGYGVVITGSGAEGFEQFRKATPAALVLDIGLSDRPGRQLFERMRCLQPAVRFIILGANSSAMERVLFLDLGADDYLAKPFSGRELVARVRAALRRSQSDGGERFSFSDVQVDFRGMEVRRQGRPLPFTAQEFKLLKFMIENADRALTRDGLLNEVWGYSNYPNTRTVDNHILKLRQKLEPRPSSPVHFLTVHGIGYKFVAQRSSGDLSPFTAPVSTRALPEFDWGSKAAARRNG